MSYVARCKNCARYRLHGHDDRCGVCGHIGAIAANDIQARTTVGSSFVAPGPNDEALVAKLASFLYGKVAMREDHATQSAAAEDYARNLVQFLILDYDIKPKDRK